MTLSVICWTWPNWSRHGSPEQTMATTGRSRGRALSSCSAFLDKRPITVHLDGDLPLVNIDTVLIERVLVNILENASKYTPQYSPIEISGYRNGDQITLTIDDHGPGLPAGQENIIFEKFERGEKENATPGIGLGLCHFQSDHESA